MVSPYGAKADRRREPGEKKITVSSSFAAGNGLSGRSFLPLVVFRPASTGCDPARGQTGSEAAALAQHAISKRHRRTEVVDYSSMVLVTRAFLSTREFS